MDTIENMQEKIAEEEQKKPESSLQKQLDEVFKMLAGLDKKFETKIKVDEHKNKMFDNMHSELTEFRNDVVMQVVNNIILEIIQLIDSNNKTCKKFSSEEPSEENYKKLLSALEAVSEDLTDILYRESVEPYEHQGDVDVKRQKIIKIIKTDDKSLDNTVAERYVSGYEKNGKVIRPERIAIYKYESKEEPK